MDPMPTHDLKNQFKGDIHVIQAPTRKVDTPSFKIECPGGADEVPAILTAAIEHLNKLEMCNTQLLAFCQTIFTPPETADNLKTLQAQLEEKDDVFKPAMLQQLQVRQWMRANPDVLKMTLKYTGDYSQHMTLQQLCDQVIAFSKFVFGVSKQLKMLVNQELKLDMQFLALTKISPDERKIMHSPMMFPMRSYLLMQLYTRLINAPLFNAWRPQGQAKAAFSRYTLEPICTQMLFYDLLAMREVLPENRAAMAENKFFMQNTLRANGNAMVLNSRLALETRPLFPAVKTHPLEKTISENGMAVIPPLVNLVQAEPTQGHTLDQIQVQINAFIKLFKGMLDDVLNIKGQLTMLPQTEVAQPKTVEATSPKAVVPESVETTPVQTVLAFDANTGELRCVEGAIEKRLFSDIEENIKYALGALGQVLSTYQTYVNETTQKEQQKLKSKLLDMLRKCDKALQWQNAALEAFSSAPYRDIVLRMGDKANHTHTLNDLRAWYAKLVEMLVAFNAKLAANNNTDAAHTMALNDYSMIKGMHGELLELAALPLSYAVITSTMMMNEKCDLEQRYSTFKDCIAFIDLLKPHQDDLKKTVADKFVKQLTNAFMKMFFSVEENLFNRQTQAKHIESLRDKFISRKKSNDATIVCPEDPAGNYPDLRHAVLQCLQVLAYLDGAEEEIIKRLNARLETLKVDNSNKKPKKITNKPQHKRNAGKPKARAKAKKPVETTPVAVIANDESERSTTPPAVIASEESETPTAVIAREESESPPAVIAREESERSTTPPAVIATEESECSTTPPAVIATEESERSTTPPAVIASERSERGNPGQTKTFSTDWATTTEEIQTELTEECLTIDSQSALAQRHFQNVQSAYPQAQEVLPHWAATLNAMCEAEATQEKEAIKSEMQQTLAQLAMHHQVMQAAYMQIYGLTQKMTQLQKSYHEQLPADMQPGTPHDHHFSDGTVPPPQYARKVPVMPLRQQPAWKTPPSLSKQAPKGQNVFKTPGKKDGATTSSMQQQVPNEMLKRPAKP